MFKLLRVFGIWIAGLLLGAGPLAASEKNCGCSCCKGKEVCCCHAEEKTESKGKTWPLKGVVKEAVAKDKTLVVKHEAIEGFMPAMTMVFQVAPEVWAAAKPGAKLTGKLRQEGEEWHLDEVVFLP